MSRKRPHRPHPSSDNRSPARPASGGGGTTWLWGVHPVLGGLANPARRCRRLLATSEAQKTHAAALEPFIRERQLHIETVERGGIDAVLPAGAVHQGLALAVEPLADLDIEDLIQAAEGRNPAVIMVLDQVTDPHNLGAVLRSAAAFGALGVIVTDRHAPSETGTLAKSASGALERVPLVRTINLARGLDDLKNAGFWIAGLDGSAPVTLAAAKLSGKIALVLGAEGEGMRRLTRERCDLLVKLPQTDAVESLNVSNAAAVALYELIRR
ncbi:MAG TPA: 23S rRNA (guanosine(2251)-2'-O)-methyltransferase RlmB [Magnetospirillaceae bacterium]|jgi:23S rRNA (guanosine2251-2'-O)-methyltransferase